jgi:hypothetical protein
MPSQLVADDAKQRVQDETNELTNVSNTTAQDKLECFVQFFRLPISRVACISRAREVFHQFFINFSSIFHQFFIRFNVAK